MASRRKARILAFQAVYSWETTHGSVVDLLSLDWIDEEKRALLDEETMAFVRLIVAGTIQSIEEVDGTIKKQLKNWDIARLSKVDLAILRISCYALLYQRDIPASITIDEAIDIAKEYSSADSFRFINGVLDGIRKTIGETK